MSHRSRHTTLLFTFLAIVMGLFPSAVFADHAPAQSARMPGMPLVLEDQAHTLLPDLRDEIELSGLPYYRIDAHVDLQTRTITATEQVTFTNVSPFSLGTAVFRLLPNATSIYAGGSLSVNHVTRDQAAARWSLSSDETALTVMLDPMLAPGASVALELEFVAVIPTDGLGYNIFHHSASVTSLAGWYPILAPYADGWQINDLPSVGDANHFAAALYDVTLVAPANQTVVSTGSTWHSYTQGGLRTWRIVSGPAREFAIALSDRYEVFTAAVDGVGINYYALPAQGRDPQDALVIAAEALAVYNARFGPYPYEELDVVETFVSVGGYEFAGMVFIDRDLRASGSLSQLRFVVSHEVAHQWWFGVVGSDPVEEPWLDESLATYSVVLYLEDVYGSEAARSMQSYYEREAGGVALIDVSALDFASWPAYRGPVYYRGALFVGALRQELGDEAFFALLKGYALRYRFGMAGTRDLTRAAEVSAGRPLDDLFSHWFGVSEPGTQS